MPDHIDCIVCKQPGRLVLENFKGYQEGMDFSIYYCGSCNTSFVWPHVVDNGVYNHIYSRPAIVPGYNRYALYAEEIISKKNALEYLADKEAMYFAIREILGKKSYKTIKILEVGSGLGYLTYAISREGFDIKGLDISADAVKRAEKQFGNHFICEDLYRYALGKAGQFDMVILTEVIEHLPDPVGFCNVLTSLLKEEGQLVITTPNKSAYDPAEYWDTESPPVHLSWFSEDSFRAIAKQQGLAISFFDFSGFNKKHIDITRFKYYDIFYKRKNRDYTLNKEGKVITPVVLTADTLSKKIKASAKKLIKRLVEPLFITFLTHRKSPGRNSILCVILQRDR